MVEIAADIQAMAQQAVSLHRAGRLAEAEALYQQILARDPAIAGPRYMLGMIRLQQGRPQEAADLMAPAAKLNDQDIGTLMNYGLALRASGRPDLALEQFHRATSLQPNLAEAHYNAGVAETDLGRFEEAIQSYEKALVLKPGFGLARGNLAAALAAVHRLDDALSQYDGALAEQPADAMMHFNRALALGEAGRTAEALAGFEQAVALEPAFIPAQHQRAILLMQSGKPDAALAVLDTALARKADDAELHNSRGVALHRLRRAADALAAFEQALALEPSLGQSWANKGLVLRDLARPDDALAAFDQALQQAPNDAMTWNFRGAALRDLGRHNDAVESFNRAIGLKPDLAVALNNRGYALWVDLALYEPALADLERVVALDAGLPYALGEVLHLKMQGGDWGDHDALKARVDDGVRAGKPVIRPFAYQAVSESLADLKRCSEIFATDQFPAQPAVAFAPREHKKIRIGYVSADFREQATAYLTAGLYEHHDREKFEIIGFDAGGSDQSPMRTRLEKAFDHITDIRGLGDAQAAAAIREAGIDILVNLNGYFGKSRMGVFARRAAPLQVNYLGFPATLGAPYMDYILADGIVIPNGEDQYYNEQVVRLSVSYQINDDKRPIGETGSRLDHGLPVGVTVFCNFNRGYKLTPATFARWCEILKQVEGGVLWLLESHAAWRSNLQRAAEAHGIAAGRLVFAPLIPTPEHLARLKLADLFLDGLPYNGHTTASDALWAGVPVLTLRGKTFPGRVAASLLTAAGLPELITETEADFTAKAVTLATDRPALTALREKLAKDRATCALFDTAATTRGIEAAFTRMWQRHEAGQAPEGFDL